MRVVDVDRVVAIIARSMAAGGRLLVCGNGGSAADAQHIAAELTGRFFREGDRRVAVIGAAFATSRSLRVGSHVTLDDESFEVIGILERMLTAPDRFVIVPIAEELAFRGFLLRRLTSSVFETVSWRTFEWAPFILSSLAFGVLHGNRWIAGTLAGSWHRS